MRSPMLTMQPVNSLPCLPNQLIPVLLLQIKTRHQLNTVKNENSFRTAVLLIKEGGVPRLYRGLTPEIVGMIPKSSAMYAGYDMSRLQLAKTPLGDSSLSVFLAGCMSGIPEAIATTPFQVVKIRLQARENVAKFSGPVDCAVQTWRLQGARGLLTGLETTIWRNSIWNSIYFYSMHEMKKQFTPPEHQHQQVIQNLFLGFVAGFMATAADAPFDTVKSRIQVCMLVYGAPPPDLAAGATSLLLLLRREAQDVQDAGRHHPPRRLACLLQGVPAKSSAHGVGR